MKYRERIIWCVVILFALALILGGGPAQMKCEKVMSKKVKAGSTDIGLQYDLRNYETITLWECDDGRGPGKLARIERR